MSVLSNLQDLCKEDPNLEAALRGAQIVADGGGELAQISNLFDPAVDELPGLLGPEAFPAEAFCTPAVSPAFLSWAVLSLPTTHGAPFFYFRVCCESGLKWWAGSARRRRSESAVACLCLGYDSCWSVGPIRMLVIVVWAYRDGKGSLFPDTVATDRPSNQSFCVATACRAMPCRATDPLARQPPLTP